MIELDEFGHAMWIHKEIPNIVLDRSYRWCDHYVMIDENQGRLCIQNGKLSEFCLDNWIPLDYESYRKRYFKCESCTPDKTCDDCKWPNC